MKTMKKLLSLLLTLALVLSLFAGLTLTAHAADAYSWSLSSEYDGGYCIDLICADPESVTSVSVPASIDGLPVIAIREYCFAYLPNLTSVTIPNGIEVIELNAFTGSPKLKTIKLPASVTTLDGETFEDSSLETINVSSSNRYFTSVDGVLFSKDKKTLIAYPPGRTATSYRVPDGVTAIGQYAFYCNPVLKQVSLPDTLTSIEYSAFSSCHALTSVQFPEGLTTIAPYAFYGSGLTYYTLPDTVSAIGDSAFAYCSWQDTIRLPKSLKHLGADALANCRSIEVDEENPWFCSVGGVLFSKDRSVLVRYPSGAYASSYTIPSGVTELAPYAFHNAHALSNVTIPDTVTKLGDGVFSESGLEEIILPAGITELPAEAFSNCSALTKVTLPEQLTVIGDSAFLGCAFAEISLPDSLTEIGIGGFVFCSNLKEIRLPEGLETLGDDAFYDCSSLTRAELPYGLSSIGSGVFTYCPELTELTIPASVTIMDNWDFQECFKLKKINYGGTRRSWDAIVDSNGTEFCVDVVRDAEIQFSGTDVSDENFLCVRESDRSGLVLLGVTDKAKNARELSIPAAINGIPVQMIAPYAFRGCSALRSIHIPEGVETIGKYAFYDCCDLQVVDLPSTLRRIEDHAFEYCSYLRDITLPAGLTELGECAFWMCESLESIAIPEGIKTIPWSTFDGCTSLRNVVLPANLERIDNCAFEGCAMSSVTLPKSLKYIDWRAFYDCKNLREVYLPEQTEELVGFTFKNSSSLKWVYIPESVWRINASAFDHADSLTDIYYEGSEADWNNTIIEGRYRMDRFNIHFNSVPAVGDFLDVRAGDWFCDAVTYAYEKGLMNGTGDYIFSPNDSLTRAQLVTILYRTKGEPEVRFRGTFSDVASGMWYSDAIEWAAANGIVNGYTDGTFKPSAKITREQIATILYRLDGSPEVSGDLAFPDAGTVSGYAVDAMRWAVSEGLINGVASGGATNLAPRNTATRAQIAAIIMRYQES